MNHITDYNLGFLLLFNPLFIGFFGDVSLLIVTYRSPSQTSDGFEEKFTDNFKLTLDTLAESNSHLIVVLGDFNIKSKNGHINDKATT